MMMAVVSCDDLFGLKKMEQDAGVTAATTDPVVGTPVPTPVVLAVNQGDIARYPDETPMPVATKVPFQRGFNIRESIPNGKIVVGLGKGVVATQLAKRSPYVLITFDDPSSSGVTMMGWVHQDAFSLVVADAGTLTCAAGETRLFSDVPTCGKVCTKDADCAAGFDCSGTSNKLAAGNKPGEAVKVCAQTVTRDAGTPANSNPTPNPTDASAPAVVDAGKSATGATGIVDAGGKNPADSSH